MKYCTHCGKEVAENARVCQHCGRVIDKNEPARAIPTNGRCTIAYNLKMVAIIIMVLGGIYAFVMGMEEMASETYYSQFPVIVGLLKNLLECIPQGVILFGIAEVIQQLHNKK